MRFKATIKGSRGGEVSRSGDNMVEACVQSRTLGIRVHSAANDKTGEDCFWIYVTSGTCQSFHEQLLGVITPDNARQMKLMGAGYEQAIKKEINDLERGLADMAMELARLIGESS